MNQVISLVVLIGSLIVQSDKDTYVRLSAMDGGQLTTVSVQNGLGCNYVKGSWVCFLPEGSAVHFTVAMKGVVCGKPNAVAVKVDAYHKDGDKEVVDQSEVPYVVVEGCSHKSYAPVVHRGKSRSSVHRVNDDTQPPHTSGEGEKNLVEAGKEVYGSAYDGVGNNSSPQYMNPTTGGEDNSIATLAVIAIAIGLGLILFGLSRRNK